VANFLDIPLTQVMYKGKAVIVEGGAIDSNGRGTLLTSEECLMHPDIQVRNPNFTKADYEAVFKEYLGITNVIWWGMELAMTRTDTSTIYAVSSTKTLS
jgi:agmatine deiminase